MKTFQLQLLKNSAVLAEKCSVAESFVERLFGLIGRAGLDPGAGLLFRKCSSVHMWGMRFAIDVIFVRDGVVTSAHSSVKPWKLLPVNDWKARDAIELPAGTIQRWSVQPGDRLVGL